MNANSNEFIESLQPGLLLAGKYRVERILGTGGMGVVVAARHLHLDETVAIKILLPHLVENADIVTRFLREGKAMIKIRSEHAVKVHDVGVLDNGAPYLVMEYLDGDDLARLLRERGPFSVEQAVDLILQACEAVAEAHVLGIVHRDLKPANLFLTHRADASQCVKVLDFGISKSSVPGSGDFEITRTQVVMGSPRYMSPEQMRSARTVDQRADIWGVGTILYELLSGAPPFFADTMTELCAQILQDPPPSLSAKQPHCPLTLELAITRALAKNPGDRFQNLAELAAAIASFGSPEAKASAQRIARVLKVTVSHASHPGMTLPLDSSITAPSPLALPTVVDGAHPSGKTGMVWGSQTGSSEPKKSNASLIFLVSLCSGLLVLVGIAIVALVLMRRSSVPETAAAANPTPVPTVETAAPTVAVPPAPAAEATPPAPSETAAPAASEATPTTKQPTSTTARGGSKPATKSGSKDLPFSGRF